MIRRNDPCPCGSGKKYKQCCLLKQFENQTLQAKSRHYFEQKYKLTNDLYSFLAQNEGGEWAFDRQKYRPFDSSLANFREGAGNMWSFFFRLYDNGLRGIEWFLQEKGQKYSQADQEMLRRWGEMKLSCYQLVDQYDQGMVIEDIWTKQTYRMPYCETMIKLPPWTVSVGMIEPYIEDWCIHGVFMWGHPDVASEVTAMVEQQQNEMRQASRYVISPAEILASNYPEILHLCNRINSRNENKFNELGETEERYFITREYTCEFPELLVNMLLDIEDKYILSPGMEPEEDKIVISRAEMLDGIFNSISVERREQLSLDDIHVSNDLATIVIEKQGVTVSGWQSPELDATLRLLESELSIAIGLTQINEQRDVHQLPKNTVLRGFNIITEKKLSDQEITAYGNLPMLLQLFQNNQEKHPEESEEIFVRRREYEQFLINQDICNSNLLRVALGLPESPFTC